MKAVQFGAGSVGRGFIAQLFNESGYEVVFVEVVPSIIERLNEDRSYPVRVVSPKGSREVIVDNVRAVSSMDFEAVADEIQDADIAATAVGVKVLPKIAKNFAQGLRKRWSTGNTKPLNIIICENLLDANHYLFNLIAQELQEDEKAYLKERVGFVEASIGKMIPVMTPKMQEGNPLRVWVEEYCELPVDKDGFRGDIPSIKNMVPFSPFEFYIQRKLFVHNAGHALTAYLGNLKNYEYIWECCLDHSIMETCKGALKESAEALSLEHGVPMKELQRHIDDLLFRFSNKALGDTVKRVGRDPVRKLSPNDRFIGACRLAVKHSIKPVNLSKGAAAALLFIREGDSSSMEIKSIMEAKGPEGVLKEICGLSPEEPLWDMILEHFHKLMGK